MNTVNATLSSKTSAATNLWCHLASVASLILSVIYGRALYPGPAHGFYGGTSAYLAFIFIGQCLFLLFFVGIPVACVYLSGRRPTSRLGIALFCLAAIVVIVEFFRVNAIPITGAS